MTRPPYDRDYTDRLQATLGLRLRAARRALGLTQEVVARRVGIATGYYSRIERGVALPSVPNLRRLGDILDVSVDHLLATERYDAPSSAPLAGQDLQEIQYIVVRAREDPDLTRFLLRLLNLCAKHHDDSDED